jgi:hypothetical protein
MIDLKHGATYRFSLEARLLYLVCKTFPNAVGRHRGAWHPTLLEPLRLP